MDYILKTLEPYKNRKIKLLDTGCGDGTLLRYFVNFENFETYGLDYNLLRLLRAQKLVDNKAHFVIGSLLEQCHKSDCFDIIVLNHVLEHIENDRQVLMNLNRILKPGGLFVLGIPNEGAFFLAAKE